MSDQAPTISISPDRREILEPPAVQLQLLQPFTDEFVARVQAAGPDDQVGAENMLWEVTDETIPIYDSSLEAKERGVKDVRIHMERITEQQIRTYEGDDVAAEAVIFLGQIAALGKARASLKEAAALRSERFKEMDRAGITDPTHRKTRRHYPILSYNHVKTAFVGDVAWLMTNNFRGLDYRISNFALKFTDPKAVEFIKDKFEKTEVPEIDENDTLVLEHDEEGHEKTTLLFDGGKRGSSVSMERALQLVDSLQPDDEFIFVSQWPPIEKVLGVPVFGAMDAALREKMAAGVKGKYLVNPEEKLTVAPAMVNRRIKKQLDRREAEEPNLDIVHLPIGTHAKALFVKRANGDTEVICGTHDFAEWTVKNGTREMSLWSKDPEITSQLEKFIEDIQQP
jgi:hypothetical protein